MKLIIADRFVLFREGLTRLIEQEPGFVVVAQAASGDHLLELAVQYQPDVILMEYELGDESGIFYMRSVISRFPDIAIVILDNGLSNEDLLDALMAGAKGVLKKTISKEVLVSSLHALERGEAIIPRSMVLFLLRELSESKNQNDKRGDCFDTLTYREFQVLKLLGLKLSNRAIANQLCISENTVRVHVHNILEKLKLRSRREAADLAVRNHLSNAAQLSES